MFKFRKKDVSFLRDRIRIYFMKHSVRTFLGYPQ